MAVIKSGVTSDILTIDPVSKAARLTLYNSSGTELPLFPAVQAVSATALPLPSGAATESTQTNVLSAVQSLAGTTPTNVTSVTLTTLGDTTLVAAPGAGLFITVKAIGFSSAAGTSFNPALREGPGGTIRKKWLIGAATMQNEPSNWKLPANTALVANLALAVAGGVVFNIEYTIT